mmetsp:Transcript_2122/g.4736  ORF Transcript_2122/g.4736 Transcript_2122/m.4736 type:complete len:147 (+) Transcript_2122:204-644(+)
MVNLSAQLTDLPSQAKHALRYLRQNAWTIIFVVAVGYFCYYQFLDPLLHRYRAAQSYKSATSPSRIAVLAPDMRRVRLQQQQIAQERSVEAETERKRKEKEVRERRRVKSPEEERWDRLGGEGVVLGDGENGGRKNSGQVQVKKQR